MSWDSYHSIEDINNYLYCLADNNEAVSVDIIGQSYEGRDMLVAKVCKGKCGHKKAVWIDGGIHAR